MKTFFNKHIPMLRLLSLIAMLALPFLLYFSAMGKHDGIVNLLLVMLGLIMLLIMKIG